MKKITLAILLSFLLFSCENKHEKTESFKVYGNCGMCKQTIEKSLKIEGVYSADWNKKTKMLTVTYDTLITSKPTIATFVAKSGYDNEFVKAKDAVYENLHTCCKYERPE